VKTPFAAPIAKMTKNAINKLVPGLIVKNNIITDFICEEIINFLFE